MERIPVSFGEEQLSSDTMRSDDITPAQAAQIRAKVRPMLGYLGRLKHRMHKLRFPHDDQLLRIVLEAYDAIHELNVHVHYLSCSSGVGRVPPKSECREYPGGSREPPGG